MSIDTKSRKRRYQKADVRSVALYVLLLVLMELALLITAQFLQLPEETVQTLESIQPWVVIGISVIFLFFYSRFWIKQYNKPTDLLNDYLENSPTIHYELRKNGKNYRVHWASKNAEQILGYSLDEITISNWWFNNLHPDDRAAVVKKALRAVDEPEFVQEYRFRHKQGHYIWVRDEIRQVDSSGNRLKGSWVNISSDFNFAQDNGLEVKNAAVTIGLADIDNAHKIVTLDSTFAEIVGLTTEQAIGLQLEDFLTRTDHAPQQPRFPLDTSIKVVGRRPDQSRFIAYLSLKRCRDDHDQLIACLTDLTELNQQRQSLYKVAFFDELTGLPNLNSLRKDFHSLLDQLPDDRLAAVLSVNIDDFHRINDTFGYHIGDKTIQRIAKRLKEALPFGNKLYAAGGDEFVILINNITEYIDVQTITENILEVFKHKFIIDTHAQFSLSCSAGASIYPLDGYDGERLLAQANSAMNNAKYTHAKELVLFQQDIAQASIQHLQLEADIPEALNKRQLELFYQPILNFNKEIIGAEALLRWNHPERGLLSPNEFLQDADKAGHLDAIGVWVLENVVQQIKRWRTQDHSVECVCINASTSQLSYNFIEKLEQLCADDPLLNDILEIEITESVLNEPESSVIGILERVAALGVKITIDDFGTGFASLSFLNDYPIHKIKIDRSFVDEITLNGKTRRMIESIVKLATEVGVKVQAEGIETEAQFELLAEIGCQSWQGNLIHPAKPVNELF
ncbi:MAG: bifunctional diguanylate cyclase/phosphodiesterase [Pseudomonadota bacterium]